MKKMMIALAGIVSVMMLASCQKEVEIDGDVSLEKTSYEYSMSVECTDATVASAAEWNDAHTAVTKWNTPRTLKADTGTVSWDNDTKSNVKKYELYVEYTGTVTTGETELEESFDLIKCKDSWYLENVLDANKVTVTGSPEDSSFTVTAKDWVRDDYEKYNFTLKFTRK